MSLNIPLCLEPPGIPVNPLELSPHTRLVRFGFTPNPVTSNEPLEFDLEIESARAMRIDELAALIFDSLNRRVALIDLRYAGEILKTNGHENLKLHVQLKQLPLVDGEYRVSFWIRSDDVTRLQNDVVTLNVIAPVSQGDFVPYVAIARGIVELDYNVTRS